MTPSDNPSLAPGGPNPDPATLVPHHGIGSRIRTYFLTGLVVAGPVAITIYLIW